MLSGKGDMVKSEIKTNKFLDYENELTMTDYSFVPSVEIAIIHNKPPTIALLKKLGLIESISENGRYVKYNLEKLS